MSAAGNYAEGCAYCGLPVNSVVAAEERYCCFGCQLAATIHSEAVAPERPQRELARLGLAIFFTMNVMVLSLALWSWHIYSDRALETHTAETLFSLLRYTSLLLTSIVTLLLATPLLERAGQRLAEGEITTDFLIVIGVLAAFGFSIHAVLVGAPHTYFEVSCMALVSVTLGRWLEAVGKLKTTQALRSLADLLPKTARIVVDNGREFKEEQRPLEEIRRGELLRVLPGERIATDGKVRRGTALVDEKIVTGESSPQIKSAGSNVFSGTLNLDGDLVIAVTDTVGGGALAKILDATAAAAMAQGRLQRTADQVAGWFVPTVIAISWATLAWHAYWAGVAAGVLAALAVLLIACPCALGVATPLAIWAALGRTSSRGVLFRHGEAFQQLADVQAICLDKTGTITSGRARVTALTAAKQSQQQTVLETAMAIASSSTHIFATAIREFAQSRLGATPDLIASDVRVEPGSGLVGTVSVATGSRSASTATASPRVVYLGNPALMTAAGLRVPESMKSAIAECERLAVPLVCVGYDAAVQGVFSLQEEIRPEAGEALQALRRTGLVVQVLTGDHAARGKSLEDLLGVPVRSELLPTEKLEAIRVCRQQFGRTVMVGDGINDAPALAEADVGIAMACGTDLARETADVCLLSDDLNAIGGAIRVAKQTMRTVRQNLFWALAYNAIGIAFAASGMLNPIGAAVAMVGSSAFVISNSLRLAHRIADDEERLSRLDESPAVPTQGGLLLPTPAGGVELPR